MPFMLLRETSCYQVLLLLLYNAGDLGGFAALHVGEGDVVAMGAISALTCPCESPALTAARQAFLLLFECLRRGVEHAKHLIHRLARLCIALRKPALTIVWATAAMAPPIDTFTRMLMELV